MEELIDYAKTVIVKYPKLRVQIIELIELVNNNIHKTNNPEEICYICRDSIDLLIEIETLTHNNTNFICLN
jgi:hypothetical protein